jgi:4-amino-4-deoxy-L-arabinose transferase-like glycosyltransferase
LPRISPAGRLADRRPDLFVFLAAAAVIGTLWLFVPGEWTIEANAFRDYYGYFAPVAKNLAAGKGLQTTEGTPATLYPPGYPLMLAALVFLAEWTGVAFETWVAMLTLSSVALAAVLLFNIAWRIVGMRCAWITAALWISYPSALWLSKQPTSDTAFLPFFYGAILLFLPLLLDETDSPRAAAVVGAVMGLAVLIRPVALLAAPLLALCAAYYGSRESWWRRLRPALFLLAGYAAVLLPWEVWAWQQTGHWILVSTNGPASMSDGLTQAVAQRGYRQAVDLPVGVRLMMEDARARQNERRLRTRGDVLAFLGDAARERPLQLAQLVWWKAKRAWYGTDSQRGEEAWLAWTHSAYLVFMVAGAVLLWQGAGSGRRWLVVSGLLVLYYWAMTVLVLSIVRYMLPAVGLMFVWQAVLVERGWERWRRRKTLETPPRPAGL